MAAPAVTYRIKPVGVQALKDGYRSLIAFSSDASIIFWEKGGNPPGMDGGDAIDVTTMHSGTWRSFRSRALVTLTDSTHRVAYHPLVYMRVLAMLNLEQSITFHYPTGHYTAFWGFLRTFETGENVEGEQPEATITVTPTNYDPVNNVEAGPVTGTGT